MTDLDKIKQAIDLAERLEMLIANCREVNILMNATNILVKKAVKRATEERYGEIAANRLNDQPARYAHEALVLFGEAVRVHGVDAVRDMVCRLRADYSHENHVAMLREFGMAIPETRSKTGVKAVSDAIIILLEDGKKEPS